MSASRSPRKRRRHQRPTEIKNKEEDEGDFEDDPFPDISDVDDSDNDPDFVDKDKSRNLEEIESSSDEEVPSYKYVKKPKKRKFEGGARIPRWARDPFRAPTTAAGKPLAGTGLMEDVFPLVFTWACSSKEASVTQIRRYLTENYPDLNTDAVSMKKALEAGEKEGQLERISGKGDSSIFALMDGADKTGAQYEDALESAIIAMNEPKDCSVMAMRNYVDAYYKEFNTKKKPKRMKNAVERALNKGYIKRLTGSGFHGTLRLAWPYYPAPQVLWADEHKDLKKDSTNMKKASSSSGSIRRVVYSEESESAEDSDDESGAETLPKSTKRRPPKSTAAHTKPSAKKFKAVAKKRVAAVTKKPLLGRPPSKKLGRPRR